MGQFACPGDVPICYGGSAEFGTGAPASITENDVPLAPSLQGTQNKTFSQFPGLVRQVYCRQRAPVRNCSSSDTNVCSTHSRGVGDSTGTVRGLPVEIDVDHRRGPA